MTDTASLTPPAKPEVQPGDALPWTWFMVLTAAILAVLVYTGTRWGPGVTPDSMEYLEAAWSFAEGQGFRGFSPHWPPLYPLVLAGLAQAGGDLLNGVRWLNSGLISVNIGLLAAIVARCDWRRDIARLFLLVLGLQAGFLHVHYLLWSEPLFLAFALADLLLLEAVLRQPQRRGPLLALACVAAMAVLTRYAGLFLLVLNAAALLLLFPDRVAASARLRRAAGVTLGSSLPLLSWLAFKSMDGGNVANRSLAWHPPTAAQLDMLGHTVATWAHLPDAVGLPLFLLLLACALWLIVRGWRGEAAALPMRALLAGYSLAYPAFLLVSITLVDFHTPLGERILFPLLPIACAMFLQTLLLLPGRRIAAAMLVLTFVLWGFGGWIGWLDWQATRARGLGFNSERFQSMPVLRWMAQLPPGARIVSNGPEVVTLHLRRASVALPRRLDPSSGIGNPRWRQELDAATRDGVLIVHFGAMAWRDYLPDAATLDRLPGVRLVYQGPDAVAWYRSPVARADAMPRPAQDASGTR